MLRYPQLAARIFNTPLLIAPAKLDAIIAGLGQRILGADLPESGMYTTSFGERKKPGYRVVDGVGVLDIFGILAHRGGLAADSSYVLGYQDIARQFQAALDDPEVRAVLLNMDTPGGEIGGAFDLARQIHAARGIKPIRAVASDLMASAGYLIGSAADQVAVTETGYAGSIGVVMRHVDFSQALATEGIRVSHIFAGARKVDGNPYEALSDEVRQRFQAEVGGLYDLFVNAVAAHRRLSAAAVAGTEADTFRGQAAVDAGLADRIATPDQLIAELRALGNQPRSLQRVSARANSERSTLMNEQTTPAGGDEPKPATMSQADVDRARAEGHAAGLADGAKAERERTTGILGHAEAVGRGVLAQQCVAQGLTVEQAGAVLAAAPKETAAAGNAFAAAMAAIGNPDVKPDAGTGAEHDAAATAANIVALFQGKKTA